MPCIICYQSMFKDVDDVAGRPVALDGACWSFAALFIDVDEDDVLGSRPATPTGPETPASDSNDEPSRKELEDRLDDLTTAFKVQALRIQVKEGLAEMHAAAIAQRDRELAAERAKVASLRAGAARSRAHAREQQKELRALSIQLRGIVPAHNAATEHLKTEIAGLEAVAQSRRARIAGLELRLADIRHASWWF